MALQPAEGVEVVVLLTPEHPRERLAHHVIAIGIGLDGERYQRGVKLVTFLPRRLVRGVEVRKSVRRVRGRRRRKAQAQRLSLSAGDRQSVMGRSLRPYG